MSQEGVAMGLRHDALRSHSDVPWRLRHPAVLPVLIGVMAVALLAVVGVVAERRSADDVLTAARGRVTSNRDAAVRALVGQTADFSRTAEALAAEAPVVDLLSSGTDAAVPGVDAALTALSRSQGSPAAFVTDLSGRTNAVYPAQPELIGKSFAYRDWFVGVSRTRATYVSEGYRSAAAGRPFVAAVAAPVRAGSVVVGYVGLLWELDSVRSISNGAKADDGVSVSVTDQQGRALVGVLDVDARGEASAPSVPRWTRVALVGRRSSATEGGNLLAAGPVPGSGWTVTASLPESVALRPAAAFRRTLGWTLLAAWLAILVMTSIATVTARRRAGEAVVAAGERSRLVDSEERFRRVFDEGLTGKLLIATSGEILQVNVTMLAVLGRSRGSVEHQPLMEVFHDPGDRARVAALLADQGADLHGEMRLTRADDAVIWGAVAMMWIVEEGGRKVLLVEVDDITGRREAEQRLTSMALHDELTGLPNRRLLLERCHGAFSEARSDRSSGSWVSVLFIDLDGFKAVNDHCGHDAGDQVLVAVATDLRQILRPTDTLARVGGDEFVVLLGRDDGRDHLHQLALRLVDGVRRIVPHHDLGIVVTASVGVARVDIASERDVRPDQLIDRADAAMYRAKQRGKNRHDAFDDTLRDNTEAHRHLEQVVREELHHDRIELVFQPVIDVDSHTVVGAEALLRLHDSEGRALPTLPAVIAAESAGLAAELSSLVLAGSLAAASTWPDDLSIAVNVSARELSSQSLRPRVLAALATHQVDPSRLVLEVTETSVLNAGRSVLEELELLRRSGVRIAIDDFGTAYATLKSLTTLPVDILKVDASFTAGLPHERAHSAVVHGIASMALELGIPCVVEGVENAEQRAAIAGMGVQAQGWWWGMPRGPGHVPQLL